MRKKLLETQVYRSKQNKRYWFQKLISRCSHVRYNIKLRGAIRPLCERLTISFHEFTLRFLRREEGFEVSIEKGNSPKTREGRQPRSDRTKRVESGHRDRHRVRMKPGEEKGMEVVVAERGAEKRSAKVEQLSNKGENKCR